jgi:hypothetical protein
MNYVYLKIGDEPKDTDISIDGHESISEIVDNFDNSTVLCTRDGNIKYIAFLENTFCLLDFHLFHDRSRDKFQSTWSDKIWHILRRSSWGTCVTLMGPDGVGKSYLSDYVSRLGWLKCKRVYGGIVPERGWFREVMIWCSYKRIHRTGGIFSLFFSIIYFILAVLNFTMRQLKVLSYNVRGWNVIIDRSPYEQFVRTNEKKYVKLFSVFDFSKGLNLLLMDKAESIYARKQEISTRQIQEYYSRYEILSEKVPIIEVNIGSDKMAALKEIAKLFSIR